MDIAHTIALTMGVAWASGINLYATLLVLGYMGMTGNIDLPPDLQILMDPMVMIAAGFMYCVEFFADKVPGVDTEPHVGGHHAAGDALRRGRPELELG